MAASSGGENDPGEAFHRAQYAAHAGSAEGENSLAFCYLSGTGTETNFAKAAFWFSKAAKQGLPDAQYRLAVRYARGEGVDQSFKESVKWLTRAANQGNVQAQIALGDRYVRGEGTKIDYVQAYKWAVIVGYENRMKVLSRKLSPAQLAEARAQAERFRPRLECSHTLNWTLGAGAALALTAVAAYALTRRRAPAAVGATGWSPSRNGFTVIEVLVVVCIIGLLAAVLLPSLSAAKSRAQRTKCAQNLRQMGLGSHMYSNDDPAGNLTALRKTSRSAEMADDSLAWLYPAYLPSHGVFICPSTQNYIRTNTVQVAGLRGGAETVLLDLMDNATNRTAPGHSYEVFGTWHNPAASYPRKTVTSVQKYAHRNKESSFYGQVAGPANTWIFLDAAEVHPPQVLQENYPNPIDNHGTAGGNVSFADGHAEWVPLKRYNFRYELSEDAARTIFPF